MSQSPRVTEIEDALAAARNSSKELEALLREAHDKGTATPELIEKIKEQNARCQELMEHYDEARSTRGGGPPSG